MANAAEPKDLSGDEGSGTPPPAGFRHRVSDFLEKIGTPTVAGRGADYVASTGYATTGRL